MLQSFRKQNARAVSAVALANLKKKKNGACSIPSISDCKILIKHQGQRESGAALGAIWDCGYASLVEEGRTPRSDVTSSLDWIRETGLNCTLTDSPFSHCQFCPNAPPLPPHPLRNHPHHKLFQWAQNRKVRRCKQVKVSPCTKDTFVFKFNCFHLDIVYVIIKL